ncbi:putative bifunctional inhibitor/plant lipid transfer protein/seed storage helical [Helianthus annuus]|nr:putative bifunctional inhibitor/plant lipid transfer protein/seed storage helical [Helianthus annuus]KAJ0541517.1 putative bifunctional inhibitor/plant lipid transfer protein/seed storage helical [Helianthus annuus]KAJ0706592.1 putative bifunctional inhibitor/plant lipid transfer protein/seed storage helical [Helianthus annuus]
MNTQHAFVVAMSVIAITLMVEMHLGMADDCDSSKFEPCIQYFADGALLPTPDTECCENLQGQPGCYCEYIKDPKICKYVASPRAKELGTACHVETPDPSSCSGFSGTCPPPSF